MSLELGLQIVQAVAVVVGVVFGLLQLHQLRVQREAQGAAEMLRSLQTTLTARAALLMYELPSDLSTAEFKAKLGDDFAAVSGLMATFESLGPLVARGHIPIDVYADYYRGATVVCWRKAQRYVDEQRAAGWSNLFEWFQWLAERMDERAPMSSDVPAQIKYRSWTKPSDYTRLR
jgi:hypothetical protein